MPSSSAALLMLPWHFSTTRRTWFGLHLFQRHNLAALVHGILQHTHQFRVVPGLGDKVRRAAFQSVHRQTDFRVCRNQHHRHVGVPSVNVLQPQQTVASRIGSGG